GSDTTQDERTMATLAHALQLIASWIAPLVIFLINRKSRFVSFHALQALLLQIVYSIVIVLFTVGWFFLILSAAFVHGAATKGASPPVALFFVIPLFWLFLIGAGITILILAIVYCIKAGRGEWAEYPVLGKWARRMLKIGPEGTGLV